MTTELALQTAHTAAWKGCTATEDGIHIDAEKLVAALEADGWIHAGMFAPLVAAYLADPHRNDHITEVTDVYETLVTHHPLTERFGIGLCPFAPLPDEALEDADWPDTPGRYRLTTDGTTINLEPLT